MRHWSSYLADCRYLVFAEGEEEEDEDGEEEDFDDEEDEEDEGEDDDDEVSGEDEVREVRWDWTVPLKAPSLS